MRALIVNWFATLKLFPPGWGAATSGHEAATSGHEGDTLQLCVPSLFTSLPEHWRPSAGTCVSISAGTAFSESYFYNHLVQ